MKKDNLNDLSIIVICYDPYIDAIELSPFFFNKYWPDCTANVIYITSEIEDVGFGYKTLTTKGDLSYYGRLKLAIENIDTDYVVLLLDDYLIDKKVNEQLIIDNLLYVKENNVDFCELFTMFKDIPKGKKINDFFVEPSMKLKYRINLQPAIFKKEYLVKILNKKPVTAWDVELIMMENDFKSCKAVFSLNHSFSITNYIYKGLATRDGRKLLKKNGMWSNQRKVMSLYQTFKKRLASFVLKTFPESLKKKLKRGNAIYKG